MPEQDADNKPGVGQQPGGGSGGANQNGQHDPIKWPSLVAGSATAGASFAFIMKVAELMGGS